MKKRIGLIKKVWTYIPMPRMKLAQLLKKTIRIRFLSINAFSASCAAFSSSSSKSSWSRTLRLIGWTNFHSLEETEEKVEKLFGGFYLGGSASTRDDQYIIQLATFCSVSIGLFGVFGDELKCRRFLLVCCESLECQWSYLSLWELFELTRDDSFCASNNKFSLTCILDVRSLSAKELIVVVAAGGSTSTLSSAWISIQESKQSNFSKHLRWRSHRSLPDVYWWVDLFMIEILLCFRISLSWLFDVRISTETKKNSPFAFSCH